MFRWIGAAYSEALVAYPVLVKSVTAASIGFTGDLFCQRVIERRGYHELDKQRLVRFSTLGFCVLGPVLHTWYGTVSKMFPGTSLTQALKRTAVDQVLFAPFMISLIISALSIIESIQLARKDMWVSLKQDLSERYFETFLMNYVFWTPAQLLNFYFIPLRYQVLFNNVASFFWTCYLSYSAASAASGREAVKTDEDEDGIELGEKKELEP